MTRSGCCSILDAHRGPDGRHAHSSRRETPPRRRASTRRGVEADAISSRRRSTRTAQAVGVTTVARCYCLDAVVSRGAN